MNAPILLEATQEAESDAALGLTAREAKDRLERGGRHATVDVSPNLLRVAVSKPGAQVPVLMMVTGDFLAISSSVDNARPSSKPSVWSSRNLTFAGVAMGVVDLASLGFGARALQTLAVVTPVFSGQTLLYVAREREHIWSSLPSRWLVASWVADVARVTVLAVNGILMARLPITRRNAAGGCCDFCVLSRRR
jgi:hypothetical protein